MIGRTLSVAIGLAILGCVTMERKSDQISGLYVREYSFEVTNPENDAKIGMRTVRDSILIEVLDDDYQISNRKWSKNDYDLGGWQNMEHSDDRQFATYSAKFNPSDGSLTAELMVPLYLKDGQLYRGEGQDKPYSRGQ